MTIRTDSDAALGIRHSKQVRREEDGGVHYDQVLEECMKKLSDDTGHWSDGMKQFAFFLRIGLLNNGYHCGGNKYSFDALQANCFGINFKL